jgi:hypothetical protein
VDEGLRVRVRFGVRVRVGVRLRVRLRQMAGRPANTAASVAQLTVEKLATVAVCEELSKWQSEKVIEYDAELPWTRNCTEFPAIALSEIVTAALTKKSPWRDG